MVHEIIEELSDINKSLVNPLLKSKILATKVGNLELLTWIDNELNGYHNSLEVDLPIYRISSATSLCTLQRGHQIQRDTPVPISLIDNEMARTLFTETLFLEGVQVLELYLTQKNDNFIKNLPIDFASFLTKQIQDHDRHLVIGDIKIITTKSSVVQILTQIRSKFLDLMLSLESSFPDLKHSEEFTPQKKSQINEKITIIMEQINVSQIQEGSSVTIGDYNNVASASGKNHHQNIKLGSDQVEKLNILLDLIKDALNAIHDPEKGEIEIELKRIETQISKQSPKSSIITNSLYTIHNLFTSIAANAFTEPILATIDKLIRSIA